MTPNERADLVHGYIADQQTDLYVYSGPVARDPADTFIELLLEKEQRRETVTLFICTYGGEADAAYRIARTLRRLYKKLRLLIAGPCKSAGTLLAVGSHQLVFGPTGELGPLDVQLAKPDEILPVSSGLDVFQAIAIATNHAYERFEEYLVRITQGSSGNISARTAAEIANRLVTGLFTPIMAQIDPLRLGEVQRAITVAKAYGERLGLANMKAGALDVMVENYPSHSFVIDAEEARKLFKAVEDMSATELQLTQLLQGAVRYPRSGSAVSFDVGTTYTHTQPKNIHENAKTGGSPEDSAARQPGESGDARPHEPAAATDARSAERSGDLAAAVSV
jgi:serine dehydrogenase proteinase